MENTIKQNTFGEMKAELQQALQNFQRQLEEKKALHQELSEKASRLTDCAYNIEVYTEYTNIGIEKYQIEREMEILDFQIESMKMYIGETDKFIGVEKSFKEMDEKTAELVAISTKQLAEIEQQIEQTKGK